MRCKHNYNGMCSKAHVLEFLLNSVYKGLVKNMHEKVYNTLLKSGYEFLTTHSCLHGSAEQNYEPGRNTFHSKNVNEKGFLYCKNLSSAGYTCHNVEVENQTTVENKQVLSSLPQFMYNL